MMRVFAFAGIALLLACGLVSCTAPARRRGPERVLFVGNSLTYVGNVPAVFASLATANGHATASDMIVRGGATLAQRVSDRSVAHALARRNYAAVVLQERGGDLLGAFGPASCAESREAIKTLAAIASRHGARVVLLGTYQSNPAASRRLVEGELSAAREAGIPYIEVSEKLQTLRRSAPRLTWFAADGVHPGKDLAMLDAALVYRALQGRLPRPSAIVVHAPIFGTRSGLTEALRSADAPPPLQAPREIEYSRAVLEKIIAILSSPERLDPAAPEP